MDRRPAPDHVHPPEFATPTRQVCTTTPLVDRDNRGEYVSGRAHASVKGQELAKIAKDRTLVGTYHAS